MFGVARAVCALRSAVRGAASAKDVLTPALASAQSVHDSGALSRNPRTLRAVRDATLATQRATQLAEAEQDAAFERMVSKLNAARAQPSSSSGSVSHVDGAALREAYAALSLSAPSVSLAAELAGVYRFGATEEEVSAVSTSPLVRRVFSLENAAAHELLTVRKRLAIEKLQRAPRDTGSPEAQVAVLSERINHLAGHLEKHRKDHSSRRGLFMLVARRRHLLQYLRREDYTRYRTLLLATGLRPVA